MISRPTQESPGFSPGEDVNYNPAEAILHEVPGIETALREVAEAVDDWPDFAVAASVDKDTIGRVGEDIDQFLVLSASDDVGALD
jgi:hypothetical protein